MVPSPRAFAIIIVALNHQQTVATWNGSKCQAATRNYEAKCPSDEIRAQNVTHYYPIAKLCGSPGCQDAIVEPVTLCSWNDYEELYKRYPSNERTAWGTRWKNVHCLDACYVAINNVTEQCVWMQRITLDAYKGTTSRNPNFCFQTATCLDTMEKANHTCTIAKTTQIDRMQYSVRLLLQLCGDVKTVCHDWENSQCKETIDRYNQLCPVHKIKAEACHPPGQDICASDGCPEVLAELQLKCYAFERSLGQQISANAISLMDVQRFPYVTYCGDACFVAYEGVWEHCLWIRTKNRTNTSTLIRDCNNTPPACRRAVVDTYAKCNINTISPILKDYYKAGLFTWYYNATKNCSYPESTSTSSASTLNSLTRSPRTTTTLNSLTRSAISTVVPSRDDLALRPLRSKSPR